MNLKEVVYLDSSKIGKLKQSMNENKYHVFNSQIKKWLQESKCPFTTAYDMLQKSTCKRSNQKFISLICRYVSKNFLPFNTQKVTVSKEIEIKVVDLLCKLKHSGIKNQKRLVKSFKLDQLDLLIVEKIAKKHLDNNDRKFSSLPHSVQSL